MRSSRWFHFVLAAGLALVAAVADAQQPPAGVYVTEGGWGTLTVRPDGRFAIGTVGANGHVCDLEGRAGRDGRVRTAEGCAMRLVLEGDKVTVAPDDATREACRTYCGMRAFFQGTYHAQQAGCAPRAVASARARFLKLHRAHQYAQAQQQLEPVLETCGRFLFWTDDAEIRNDLAVSHARAGDKPGCLALLGPLRRLFIDDPEKSGIAFAPSDEEWAAKMGQATRYNWRLCGGSLPAGKP